MKWIVMKTVTEYHTFTVEADTEEEARDLADDNHTHYCHPDDAYDTIVEIQRVFLQ